MIRRKLWKGSGTGSTQLASGILWLFLGKLNNSLEVLKGRNPQEWRFRANVLWKWNREIHKSAGRYLREMMWDESFNWQNGKEPVKKLSKWVREREKKVRRTGCCRSSRFSRELEPDSGRGTAAGDWYVCEGNGGSAGAGITLQAGKSLWRWWRGLEVQGLGSCLMAVCSVHVDVYTHTCFSALQSIPPKTLHAALSWTYNLFHICFSKKNDYYFKDKRKWCLRVRACTIKAFV